MPQATSEGLNPVAKFDEVGADMYFVADDIADAADTDFVFAAVVHGDMYLAEWADDDAYWSVDAEISEGETGDWSGSTDLLANDLPAEYRVVDILGDGGRYLVTVQGDE